MLAAIERFLVLTTARAAADPLRALARSLAELALRFHELADKDRLADPGEPDRIAAARSLAQAATRDAIGRAYPELGLYLTALGIDPADYALGVGDAIDDIEDIARDLADALEDYGDGGWEAVIDKLAFWYRAHLWEHIAELQRCLAWTISGALPPKNEPNAAP